MGRALNWINFAINHLINLGLWNFQVLLALFCYTFSEKIMILQWKIIIVYLVTGDFLKTGFIMKICKKKKLGCSREIISLISLRISIRNIHWKNYQNWAIKKVMNLTEICLKCVNFVQKFWKKIYMKSGVGHRANSLLIFVEYMSFESLKTLNTIF